MKTLFIKSVLLVLPIIALLSLSLLILANMKARRSLLAGAAQKHERISSIPSPKIVFVGGSNLSFGMDSKRVQDSLGMPVVNMAMHAGLGLRYMLEEAAPYVKKGDVFVVVPEYAHFTEGNMYDGQIELAALAFDAYPAARRFIEPMHWIALFPILAEYAKTKIESRIPFLAEGGWGEERYSKDSFNEWGDAVKHWELPPEDVEPYAEPAVLDLNNEALEGVADFVEYAEEKGATVVMLPPVFQSTSYDNTEALILETEAAMRRHNTPYAVDTDRYRLPDSLFLDTPYHLIKEGVDKRTGMVIEDLAPLADTWRASPL